MVLRLNQQPIIENLRNYPAETVEKLRRLLASGAQAQPDPHRADFYEVENDSHVYYVHISPINGKVMLLGKWLKTEEPVGATSSGSTRAV